VPDFLPSGPDERRAKLMDLARALKLNEFQTLEESRPVVLAWHDLARSAVPGIAFVDTWADFKRAFGQAKVPYGDNLLADAHRVALTEEIPAPAGYPEFREDPALLYVYRLALAMVRRNGSVEFFLGCPSVEKISGHDRKAVNKRLHYLEDVGFIRCTERGKVGGKRASRYQWLNSTV
jgi:hypothetical protein